MAVNLSKGRRPKRTGPYLRSLSLKPGRKRNQYPWNVPIVKNLSKINFDQSVTFLVGDNGSGKSTLVEAIAIGTGFNSEGGNRHYMIEEQPTVSPLAKDLVFHWTVKPAHGWFLRAESFYNVATFIEDELDISSSFQNGPLHERSHGESFIDLAMSRFVAGGFYVLDEPEAALSFQGALRMLSIMRQVVEGGGQFIVATHSPVLLAYPGASIYQLGVNGCEEKTYEEVESVLLWRSFMNKPEAFVRHLFTED